MLYATRYLINLNNYHIHPTTFCSRVHHASLQSNNRCCCNGCNRCTSIYLYANPSTCLALSRQIALCQRLASRG